MNLYLKSRFFLTGILYFFLISVVLGQTTVISDNLIGGTVAGKQYGGVFTGEGYVPGTGTNHILYTVPSTATNGYVEFQVKGVNASQFPAGAEHGFLIMYDGRGITEPVKYLPDFRENFFRWNLHWRQSRGVMKAVVNCAAPTSARLNASTAIFPGNWTLDERDYVSEPNGRSVNWNPSLWYTIRVEWKNKRFQVFVNGSQVWADNYPYGHAAVYDYDPIDHRIWLGSGTGKYGADISNIVYRNFKVVDYGGGTTPPPSNTLVVNPSNRSVGASAGSTSFTITSNVNWNVSDNANWLTLSASSGSNNGTLNASFSANTSSNSRTANITASGGGINRTVTVTQAGTSGSGGGGTGFTVSPTSKSVEKAAGSFNVSITTSSSWRVSDNTDWMRKTPKTGTGNGTSRIDFYANNTGSTRTGIISVTVGSEVKQIMVTQSSSGTTSTSLAVSPANSNVGSSSGSASFSVTSNVSWNATDNAGWLTLSPSSGSNNGTITASYSANTNSSSRTAIITTSGGGMSKTVTLTQAGTSGSGGGGSFTVSPSSKSVGNGAGYFNLAITTSGSWRVRDNTNWMRKVPKTGTGNGTSRIEFGANTTGAPRKGIVSVTVGNEVKEIVVTQGDNGSSGGSFTVSPSSKSIGNGAGYFNLSITTSGNWRVRDNTNWMRKVPKTGSGNGTSRIEFVSNTTGSPRTGIISVTVGNEVKEVVVTQEGTSQSIASVELSKESAGFRSEKAEEIEVIPTEYGLDQNYPNPFNPTTTITYSMPIEGHAEIVVYNSIGEVVKSLVSEFRSAGTHRITFDASNLSSGIYFYKFKSGKFTDNKKMILLK